MIIPRIPARWPTATLLSVLVVALAWVIFVSGSTRSDRVQAQAKKPAANKAKKKAATDASKAVASAD